jgi:hypothetical protein
VLVRRCSGVPVSDEVRADDWQSFVMRAYRLMDRYRGLFDDGHPLRKGQRKGFQSVLGDCEENLSSPPRPELVN